MKRNERGFMLYTAFRDSYGSEVRVQESSASGDPHVWIFCHNDRHGHADPLSAVLGGGSRDFTPHLNVAQARRLVRALNAFIRHRSPRSTP